MLYSELAYALAYMMHLPSIVQRSCLRGIRPEIAVPNGRVLSPHTLLLDWLGQRVPSGQQLSAAHSPFVTGSAGCWWTNGNSHVFDAPRAR
jgi:hypothetical protein